MLLQAYDNEDADAARAALNNPFIKHMDVEYAKLARGLPLPQQEYAIPPPGVRANAAESYTSPNASKLMEETTSEVQVKNKFFYLLIYFYSFIYIYYNKNPQFVFIYHILEHKY